MSNYLEAKQSFNNWLLSKQDLTVHSNSLKNFKMKLGTYLGSDNRKVMILTSFNVFPFCLTTCFLWVLILPCFLILALLIHLSSSPQLYLCQHSCPTKFSTHREKVVFPCDCSLTLFPSKFFLLSLEVEINNWYVLKINSISKLSWDPMTVSTGGAAPVILYYVLSSYINIQLFLVKELMSSSLKYDN